MLYYPYQYFILLRDELWLGFAQVPLQIWVPLTSTTIHADWAEMFSRRASSSYLRANMATVEMKIRSALIFHERYLQSFLKTGHFFSRIFFLDSVYVYDTRRNTKRCVTMAPSSRVLPAIRFTWWNSPSRWAGSSGRKSPSEQGAVAKGKRNHFWGSTS